jgi:hypothetical protein
MELIKEYRLIGNKKHRYRMCGLILGVANSIKIMSADMLYFVGSDALIQNC